TGAAAGSGVGSGAEVAAPGGVGSDAEVADGSEPSLLLVARIGEPVQTISLVDDSAVYLGVPYVVGLDSAVYQPVATDEGYRLVRHTFPETPGFSEGER
ncbi:MAG TPA: hypothetical protein VFD74_05410, partial [Thermoleophilia bacterium]|nr:hypothetical protein [Thermoleophilia bacterium]